VTDAAGTPNTQTKNYTVAAGMTLLQAQVFEIVDDFFLEIDDASKEITLILGSGIEQTDHPMAPCFED